MKHVDVRRIYESVVSTAKHLPVKLPGLQRSDGKFTVGGLTLVFFASRMGEIGKKAELNRFLRTMRCESTDPQPRHLGMQNGLNFLVKGCYHPVAGRVLRSGEYSLLDLASTHPSAGMMHRSGKINGTWFDRLKREYDHRCACCGSKEGERHYKNPHVVTTLDKGHCDPRKPLKNANCIPMCALCNMVYRDHAVFNRRGFIVEWLLVGNRVARRSDAIPCEEECKQKKGGIRQGAGRRRKAGIVGVPVACRRRRVTVMLARERVKQPTVNAAAAPVGRVTRSQSRMMACAR
jgi:hypothetical protein